MSNDTDVMAEPGLHLFAKMALHLESIATRMEREAQRAFREEQRRLAGLPNIITFEQIVLNGANTTAVQDMTGSNGYGPQPGRTWIVRLINAVASPLAANAAVVTWYVGPNVPGPAPGQLPATMTRWQFASVPGFQSFTSNVFQVLPHQRLLVGLTGIPANSAISLVAVVNEQPFYAQQAAVAVE